MLKIIAMHSARAITIAVFIFFFSAAAFADNPVIKAEVSKKSITTDETIIYKITITAPEKTLPAPQVPKPEGFAVISQVQSSSLSLARGELKTSVSYIFVLLPTTTGKLTIPAASIKIGDKTYSAETIEVEVKLGTRKPAPLPQAPPAPQAPSSEEEQPPQITL